MAFTEEELHKDRPLEPQPWVKRLLLGSLLFGAVVAVGVLVAPEIFWDQWIYPYYWGPIAADGHDARQGSISEGYNVISTATYGAVLIIAITGIWELLRQLRISFDFFFFVALIPYICTGALLRVQEDAHMFDVPLGFLFIAPIIYINIGLVTLALLLASIAVSRASARYGIRYASQWGLWLVAVVSAVPLLAGLLWPQAFTYQLDPLLYLATGGAVGATLAMEASSKERLQPLFLFWLLGLLLLSWALIPLFSYGSAGYWPGLERPPGVAAMNLGELPVVFGLAAAATVGVGLVGHLGRHASELLARIAHPLNLLLFFAHFLDAAATFRALDLFGYGEKHVLPNTLIQLTGTAAVMFPLKLAVVVLVVYVLDIELKEDLREFPIVTMLMRATILVLGLAPGLRDIGRLALGV